MRAERSLLRANAEEGHQYARDVSAGTIVASQWVKKACRRHLDDLANQGEERGLYFNTDDANDALQVFSWVRYFKGRRKGEVFVPEPWQVFIVASLFGWRLTEDDTRRYRQVYVEVARKNGKTHLAAMIALIAVFFDGESGAEGYSCAMTRQQARIVFEIAHRLVGSSTQLRSRLQRLKNVITYPELAQKFHAVSRQAQNLDGLDPHFVACDEYHAHPDASLLNVLVEGTAARRQPVTLITTTAGPGGDPTNACKEERDRMTAILQRAHAGEDPWPSDDRYFAYIACLDTRADGADQDDDPFDTRTWIKANPNLGVSVNRDFLADEIDFKKGSHGFHNVLRKHFNLWVGTSDPWIQPERWAECAGKVDWEALEGRPCYGGLDLSSNTDLTGLVLYFPEAEGPAAVFSKAWVPEDRIDLAVGRDKAPYRQWQEKGHIEATPGDVVDYEYIRRTLSELAVRFDIMGIAYDPHLARDLAPKLVDDGIEMVPISQSFSSLGLMVKRAEIEILKRRIAHGNNPVLTWCVNNTVLEINPGGLTKPSKRKSTSRIDLAVCFIMAIGMWATMEEEGSRYNDPDAELLVI